MSLTSAQLYAIVAQLGLIESVKGGYFNNLKYEGTDNGGRIFAMTTPVKSPDPESYPSGKATLDLTPFNLALDTFTLTGSVKGGVPGVIYKVTFSDITTTSAVLHVMSEGESLAVTVPTLDVTVSVTILAA